jgi:hydroxyacyl-ACP dehydratase HTD2-like protein with hotdog domain
MTALLLTQLASTHVPRGKRLAFIQYRATHPLIVNQPCSLHGVFEQDGLEMRLWASNENGAVGMRAQAGLERI